jgi:hypothetical protein
MRILRRASKTLAVLLLLNEIRGLIVVSTVIWSWLS